MFYVARLLRCVIQAIYVGECVVNVWCECNTTQIHRFSQFSAWFNASVLPLWLSKKSIHLSTLSVHGKFLIRLNHSKYSTSRIVAYYLRAIQIQSLSICVICKKKKKKRNDTIKLIVNGFDPEFKFSVEPELSNSAPNCSENRRDNGSV